MRRKVLLITHTGTEKIGTVREHVRALEYGLDADVLKVDYAIASRIDFSKFDVVILHYSLIIASPRYISARLKEQLRRFSGLCILFIQDEYRWIDRTAEAIRDLGVAVVFTVVNPDVVRKIYHHPWCNNLRFEQTLTGFVPEPWLQLSVPDYEQRPIDVGYRARKVPAWLGRQAEIKWKIGEKFAADAARFKLKVDIAFDEARRIYGTRWIEFLSGCRAVLGTESSASVCDFSGEIQKNTERHLAAHPGTSSEQLRALYFSDVDGKIAINVISPRCFEAAALRTLMIMYPGEYSGVLTAGRHYVPLQPDHSNMEEVVDVLRTPKFARSIIRAAYEEVACSKRWTYAALAAQVDRVIKEEAGIPVGASSFPRAKVASIRLLSQGVNIRRRLIESALLFGQSLAKDLEDLFRLLPGGAGRQSALAVRKLAELVRRWALGRAVG